MVLGTHPTEPYLRRSWFAPSCIERLYIVRRAATRRHSRAELPLLIMACAGRLCVIAVIWEFEVESGKSEEFERFYGADGEWTKL